MCYNQLEGRQQARTRRFGMQIKTTEYKRVDLVELAGRIDSNTASELEAAFEAITSQDRYRIVVDMQDLEYVSSRGLRALISTLKTTRRWNRGDLRLCNVPERIAGVLDLAGLTPLFKIYDSAVDAVGSF
jgi:anti-sigma B factor antagonist